MDGQYYPSTFYLLPVPPRNPFFYWATLGYTGPTYSDLTIYQFIFHLLFFILLLSIKLRYSLATFMTAERTSDQSCHWVFTWNNPTLSPDQFRAAIADQWNCSYAIFQPELGESGTPHFQGYVEWPSKLKKRLSTVRKLIPQAHWEPRRGTRDQAREYCTPDGLHDDVPKKDIPGAVAGPFIEVGVWQAAAQGKRTDLAAAIETLKTRGWNAMVDGHSEAFVKFSRGLACLAAESVPQRTEPPFVCIYYGPTGCGKSRMAFTNTVPTERWTNPIGSNGGWYDGYHGQRDAILDDFSGKLTGYRLDDFLRLTDRYNVMVPVKGAFVQWSPTTITITTNIHPSQWWEYEGREEHYLALQRRIACVYSWGRDGRLDILTGDGDGVDGGELWRRWWLGPQRAVAVPRPAMERGMADWVELPAAPDSFNFFRL